MSIAGWLVDWLVGLGGVSLHVYDGGQHATRSMARRAHVAFKAPRLELLVHSVCILCAGG